MGKQRTPHGQRAGRRMPLRPGPAASPAAEIPTEAMSAAEPQPSQEPAGEGIAPAEAEILEAAPAATEASAEAVTEAVPEPASDGPAEDDAVTEPHAATAAAEPEEPASVNEAAGETPEQIVPEEIAEVAASDEARDEASESVLSDPIPPVAALAALDAAGPSEAGARRPPAARTAFRFTFAPVRIDVEEIGVVLANYMHNESVAVLSYMRALGAARSPADMIRLNVTEMQRAADASLTCWSDIARRTAPGVPWEREKVAA
ncbi:hypothetical protein GCM10007886_53720 [Methylobacterium gregans]|uniref:Phasin domain-containing protein n=1 Tax=Methylobacterium gregans TaxID=374424 RepID=A0AA37HL52_9HYPH|nr:hypothetical protein [Methylobacterium gregans]MDQ0522551.1 hypothetical protein [Methylobacterium gregans]GJD77742.1 hypothetical protein NBEOAGPD_0950 [Methylobacterium gregans]GLS57186.1 hypothetical protein GCM10007886_53720 [Methylobacterium gregans]